MPKQENSSPLTPHQSPFKGSSMALSPWLVGLLPWVIDLLFQTGFLGTLSGALLWGLILVVYFTQDRLVDIRLKRSLNMALLFLSVLWVGAWLQKLLSPHQALEEPAKALYFLHATFLMASTGALLVVLWSAVMGILRARSLSNSQSPLTKVPKKYASLEGLFKLCTWSLGLAKVFWLLGCVLALLALTVKIAHTQSSWSIEFKNWISYPTVWAVWGVALALSISESSLKSNPQTQSVFRNSIILSLFCLVIVGFVLMTGSTGTSHFAGEFLR